METNIEGRCLFERSGAKCGGPLVYDQKYDLYKCQVHGQHYAISREEYERRHRISVGILTPEEQRIISEGLHCPWHDDVISRLVSESYPWNGKVCCQCGEELEEREEKK